MTRRRSRTPAAAMIETATAANAAAMTIGMRMLKMQQAMLLGDASGGPEARRMVTEKIAAAQAGYWALAKAMTPMMWSPPTTLWDGFDALSSAMLRPAYKKARRNARRLTRIR